MKRDICWPSDHLSKNRGVHYCQPLRLSLSFPSSHRVLPVNVVYLIRVNFFRQICWSILLLKTFSNSVRSNFCVYITRQNDLSEIGFELLMPVRPSIFEDEDEGSTNWNLWLAYLSPVIFSLFEPYVFAYSRTKYGRRDEQIMFTTSRALGI